MPGSADPRGDLTIRGLFYADVFLLDMFSDKLTSEARQVVKNKQKELYELLPKHSYKEKWTKAMAVDAFNNVGKITHINNKPVKN